MIIKKRNFNLTPRCKGLWPFTVPEVAVIMARVGEHTYFAIAHNFGLFALNQELVGRGFGELAASGIWALDAGERESRNGEVPYAARPKSLKPFFDYLNRIVDAAEELAGKGVNGE